MPRTDLLKSYKAGDLKDWLKIIDKRIRDRRQIFCALGPDLQAAMIAAEVMTIQRMQANEDAPIRRFNDLYMAACQKHLPEYYGTPGEQEKTQ